jgi:molybdopterin/thiamine biosynthesis adenylyltransferase
MTGKLFIIFYFILWLSCTSLFNKLKNFVIVNNNNDNTVIAHNSLTTLSKGYSILTNMQNSVIRRLSEKKCLLSSISWSTWDTIKTNTYLYRVIQYLHNGV